MTEAERQTVIDALNLAVLGTKSAEELLTCRQALAIMRREREPAAAVLEGGDCFRLAYDLPAGTKLYTE